MQILIAGSDRNCIVQEPLPERKFWVFILISLHLDCQDYHHANIVMANYYYISDSLLKLADKKAGVLSRFVSSQITIPPCHRV